ncbi:beta-crystallin A2b isoform X2 [Betta splendens]|uniref:Beta-crystallin A2 n=2 Tax=Betta splendens TaxID=158456 RepID=A0A6P7LEG2_BETSP|nr:beta-crystallin A2b isoform X2 [Betta splendens]
MTKSLQGSGDNGALEPPQRARLMLPFQRARSAAECARLPGSWAGGAGPIKTLARVSPPTLIILDLSHLSTVCNLIVKISASSRELPPKGEDAAMNTQQMEQMGQFKITVWEEENFQGKRCEFMLECQNIMERGFNKIRSIKVENGPWVGYEYPEFQGQQFILEKGDYPCYEAWSGNSSYRTEHLLSFRPIKCANHSDSKVTLYECEDFQGRKFEMCDDYPSLQAMGWCSKEVPSIKINSGAWVAYQFPGYRGYQYILERDRHQGEYRNYNEYSTQAHTNQVQSIRRIQH